MQRRPRGPDRSLRRDAAALAGELRRGPASSTASASTRVPAAVEAVSGLLRGRIRRAPDPQPSASSCEPGLVHRCAGRGRECRRASVGAVRAPRLRLCRFAGGRPARAAAEERNQGAGGGSSWPNGAFERTTPTGFEPRSDPDLSPDGRRVAFAVVDVDQEADRLRWSIWVAPVDGSAPPRRFTEGPADKSPLWSPDGRWLAYMSFNDDQPDHPHVRLAPLDGGMPSRLGELLGPVSQFAWSPDSSQIAVVCRVGAPDLSDAGPKERNAPRVPRGLAARLDGVGWHEGRCHLFVVDVATGLARQLTRGEYDHEDPAFSPDGATIAFVSDRHPRRDDRQFRSDLWTMPVRGGRPRRLTGGKGSAAFPTFSPDGRLIAFAGQDDDRWDADSRVFVVAADGASAPERVAPDLDRPTLCAGPPAGHLDQRTGSARLIADLRFGGPAADAARAVGQPRYRRRHPDRRLRGAPGPSRARLRRLVARPAGRGVRGAARGRRACSAHRPEQRLPRRDRTRAGQPFDGDPPGRHRGRVLHDPAARACADIAPARRHPRRPARAWPSGRWLAFHQALAAAGHVVVLPNPRGSTSYGQVFTSACTGDWEEPTPRTSSPAAMTSSSRAS